MQSEICEFQNLPRQLTEEKKTSTSKILNLSKCKLSRIQTIVSEESNKFTPTTLGNKTGLRSDPNSFTRKLQLKENIHNQILNDDSYYYQISNN